MKKKTPETERVAVARVNTKPIPHGIMLDSGTTAHMTPYAGTVQNKCGCNVDIALGDDSIISAKMKGVRKVRWQGADGPVTVSLTDTLIAPDATLSLLSVPALTKKDIAVLFLPGKAILFDIKDNNSVLGYAKQGSNDLYYIDDNRDEFPVDVTGETSHVRAFMAVTTTVQSTGRYSTESNDSTIVFQDEDYESEIESDTETDSESQSIEFASSETDSDNEELSSEEESSGSENDDATENSLSASSNLWHLRLGHAWNRTELQRHVKGGFFPKITKHPDGCEVCVKAKFRKRHKGSLTNAVKLGHLHADPKGKIKKQSKNGDRYCVTVVDEFSRYMLAKPIQKKSDASAAVQEFVAWFERHSGRPICSLHTDGGTEFFYVQPDLKKEGTDIHCITAYTPQSNGLAERCHGIILCHTRAILRQSKLPIRFWNYAILHAVKCKNLLPHSTTGKIRFEVVHGHHSTQLQYIRPFGCRMLYHPITDRLPTFESKLYEGICIGHDGGEVYIVLTVDGIIRTKHVKPFEQQFPGLSIFKNESDSETERDGSTETDEDSSDYAELRLDENSDTDSSQSHSSGGEDDVDDDLDEAENKEDGYADITHIPEAPSTHRDDESDTEDGNDSEEEVQRPSNLRQIPRIKYNCRALPMEITTEDEPKLSIALKSPERHIWLDAIQEEFDKLEKSKTWEIPKSQPTPGKVIPSAMILKLKRDENGLPERFKGRLVALENFQSDQLGLVEVYAPVTCIETVRILLAVAYAKAWKPHHVDIKGAFLYSLLSTTDAVWIKLPRIEGVPSANGQIVKLRKSLYGLRQAPKLWYKLFTSVLKKNGFRRSDINDCLFMKKTNIEVVYLLLYVDDILLFGEDSDVIAVKKILSKYFTTTDLGIFHHFFGLKFENAPNGIFIFQRPFIEKIIRAANLENSKPITTPLPLSHCFYEPMKNSPDNEAEFMSTVPYRNVLGSLILLSTRTRPDISTAVSMLGKFQEKPGRSHSKLLQQVVRYLIGTIDHGLFLPKTAGKCVLYAWSDGDWARDNSNPRSRTGYLLTMSVSPIVWCSKLQTSTSLSSTEAEFYSLAYYTREVMWIRDLLKELDVQQRNPTLTLQDNLGTMTWTK